MPKAPNQKYKLFYILELLRSESDEKHPVTMPQIISYLKQNGIHAERKSVYSDMEALQILGYDVVCQKNPAGYYLGSREFELAELKLLVDAVQASKFITQKQSRNLIEKLEHFTSRHEAKRLQRHVCVNDRVKTENLSSLYLIDDIHHAMHENQPVSFVYCEWNQNKELVPRHKFLVLIPFAVNKRNRLIFVHCVMNVINQIKGRQIFCFHAVIDTNMTL